MKICPFCWKKCQELLGPRASSLALSSVTSREYKVCLRSCWTEALELCVWPWMCGAGFSRRALSSLSRQKTEEVSNNMCRLRFGSLQKLWRSSNVLVKQLGAAHSRASCWSQISPRPLAFTSNVQGWPRLQLKHPSCNSSNPLRHSCTCGKNHRILRGIAHRRQFTTKVLPLFLIGFWSTVLEATSKTIRDGVSIQKECDQECGDEAKAILEYSSSPRFTRLSSSLVCLMDCFGKFMDS